ncbi:TauD/TfdA family dioxygenase [Rosenbergiella collisarenosi]|uniref:TauD/TfdA dioxygenase family protein n=1 Tax=Rosenbergiella collisarenosi TaxID=1544695 RepID=UPI001BDB0B94|nr:TauD/TfdA family dioxygenase [Rosenbergiella collisarenosi]MBT0722441.1 TauD/TfdA family dioxygenase [Rosenbergiella collisarenosi]
MNRMPEFTLFGEVIDANEILRVQVTDIKSLLLRKGFIIVNDISFTREEFAMFFSGFGDVVRFVTDPLAPDYKSSDVTVLQGRPDDIVAGRGQLPLHADGGTTDFIVDHLFLFALEVSTSDNGGATCLVNYRLANLELPESLRRILFGRKHYMRIINGDVEQTWKEIPVFSGMGRAFRMMIYFPFDEGQPASWECAVEGLTTAECRQYYRDLQAFYRQPRYYYRHYWTQNQLLICDNRLMLHEREPYSSDGQTRILMRGLTREPADELSGDMRS